MDTKQKTLIVVFGDLDEELNTYLKHILDKDLYLIRCLYDMNNDAIIQALVEYDNTNDLNDIVFITTNLDSSEFFVKSRFDEKVLLRNISYKYNYNGLSIVWNDMGNLPVLIQRLGSNISENANF
jgi:hypothetical protein